MTASQSPGPPRSQRLRQRGAAVWAAATGHPMVAAIGAGTLPHETFRFYFEQNVQYLHAYVAGDRADSRGRTRPDVAGDPGPLPRPDRRR